jgi:hypothetical protein
VKTEHDDAIAIGKPRNCRVGLAEARQILPVDLQFTRAHAAAARDVRQQLGGVVVRLHRMIVLNAVDRKIDAVMPRHCSQALQCCFERGPFHRFKRR